MPEDAGCSIAVRLLTDDVYGIFLSTMNFGIAGDAKFKSPAAG
jgi:hypothetical protein